MVRVDPPGLGEAEEESAPWVCQAGVHSGRWEPGRAKGVRLLQGAGCGHGPVEDLPVCMGGRGARARTDLSWPGCHSRRAATGFHPGVQGQMALAAGGTVPPGEDRGEARCLLLCWCGSARPGDCIQS